MSDQNILDRRTFIKRAALASAALFAVSALPACSSGSSNSSSASTTSSSSNSTSSTSNSSQSDSPTTSSSAASSSANSSATSAIDYSTGTHHATIEVADYGTIALELYADKAPITVANFAGLVNQSFYDELTFHRIVKGFMVQGGDPTGTGKGGSGTTIKGEFSANGVQNDISHERGTLSMARSQAYDSASSQFFIMQKTNTSLNGQYSGFGKVTSGIEIVDSMCEKVPVIDSNGTVAKAKQPVMTSVRMVD